jgi:hypothetical protein
VEVADDLVDPDAAVEAASLLSLCIEFLGIVLALALLDALAAAERPRYRGVCVADIVAGVTAAGLDCVLRGGCAVAFSTVVGGKMLRLVLVSAEVLGPRIVYGLLES